MIKRAVLCLALLLTACSSGVFESDSDSYIISMRLTDTIEQATEACLKVGAFASYDFICGCYWRQGMMHNIISVKRWDVVTHELTHMTGETHAHDVGYCHRNKWFIGGF